MLQPDFETDDTFITIQLPLQIGPLDRAELWEDPLLEHFEKLGFGDVTGGGTMMDADGGIAYIDVEVALPDTSDEKLDQLQSAMLQIGAPKNTKFIDDAGTELRTFGTVCVAGIGLDGTGLPDEAYDGFDPDDFNEEVLAALGEGYVYGGSHPGSRYTFFYYHGADPEYLERKLREIAAGKPIGQGAQIKRLA